MQRAVRDVGSWRKRSFGGVTEAILLVRNGVEAAAATRTAAREAAQGEQTSAERAMTLDRVVRVARAGGFEAARGGQDARDGGLVGANQPEKGIFHERARPFGG